MGMDSINFKDEFHGMGDAFHTFLIWNPWKGDGLYNILRQNQEWGWIPYFFIFFISPNSNPYGLSSYETLVKSTIYNVLKRTTYINLFNIKGKGGREWWRVIKGGGSDGGGCVV